MGYKECVGNPAESSNYGFACKPLCLALEDLVRVGCGKLEDHWQWDKTVRFSRDFLICTVDGSEIRRSPVDMVNFHYLQGFIHVRWLFGISEPSTVSRTLLWVLQQRMWQDRCNRQIGCVFFSKICVDSQVINSSLSDLSMDISGNSYELRLRPEPSCPS